LLVDSLSLRAGSPKLGILASLMPMGLSDPINPKGIFAQAYQVAYQNRKAGLG